MSESYIVICPLLIKLLNKIVLLTLQSETVLFKLPFGTAKF